MLLHAWSMPLMMSTRCKCPGSTRRRADYAHVGVEGIKRAKPNRSAQVGGPITTLRSPHIAMHLFSSLILLPALCHALPSGRDSSSSDTQYTTSAAEKTLNPYPDHRVLAFRNSSTEGEYNFRLTVFSDVHFGENPWDAWGLEQDRKSLALMREVLEKDEEAIDYVVLNGDLITGENTFRENSTDLINQLLTPFIEHGVPFSTTHGNHDNQPNITHAAEIERELSIAPTQSFTRIGDADVGGVGGPGNYWVPVYLHESDPTPILVLWFFDSRGGFSTTPGQAIDDWVDDSVAKWIETESAKMNEAWGTEDRHALAFMHIPSHHIEQTQDELDSSKTPGQNGDSLGRGSTQDSALATRDQPFWDSLNTNVKNLIAVVSGHDHGNEWCARESSKDVVFCFAKHSGYGGYSRTGWGRGVRHFELTVQEGTEGVNAETWIWVKEGGEERARVTLGEDYGR